MTLAEATRQYQIAREHLRAIKGLELHSLDREYEEAEKACTDAYRAMRDLWLEHAIA